MNNIYYKKTIEAGREKYREENFALLMNACKDGYVELLSHQLSNIKDKKSVKYGFIKDEIADITSIDCADFLYRYAVDCEQENLYKSMNEIIDKESKASKQSIIKYDANNPYTRAILMIKDAYEEWDTLTINEQIEAKTYEIYNRLSHFDCTLENESVDEFIDNYFFDQKQSFIDPATKEWQKESKEFNDIIKTLNMFDIKEM